jgi:hypothetical protein
LTPRYLHLWLNGAALGHLISGLPISMETLSTLSLWPAMSVQTMWLSHSPLNRFLQPTGHPSGPFWTPVDVGSDTGTYLLTKAISASALQVFGGQGREFQAPRVRPLRKHQRYGSTGSDFVFMISQRPPSHQRYVIRSKSIFIGLESHWSYCYSIQPALP